ncbi:transcription repressor NadR [Fusibacter paucivorans]|uniref:Transcription repressor NadR n=1 Tax=Fusibacter paucivorans TaxID=76009 RepID=A0ABS5PPZ5_9FIRM|nr:transcription repressor NadR [Fusibacter paucivorans]MBS7527133.1 transcription repressor NadR [Fusibacter paucivorans]
MSNSRRREIISLLKKHKEAITGTVLAEMLGVSRQVIVQDIAVLRAQGTQIIATSNGYTLPQSVHANRLIKTLISKHEGFEQMEEELMMIIEYGGKVIDVIVEHPVYGEIVGNLHLTTVDDVQKFMEKVRSTNAKPLASLTEGEHIHTIEIPSEKVFNLLVLELKEKGYIQ